MRYRFAWWFSVLALTSVNAAALLPWLIGQTPPPAAPPRPLPPLTPTSYVPSPGEPAAVAKPGRDLSKLPPLTQQMYLSAQRGSEWLCRVHQPSGRFLPGWQPDLNQPLEGDHYLRQAGAALALARSARFLKDERYAARARQAVLTLLAETGLDPRDPQSRCVSLPPAVVNRLGAAGLLLAAIHELPDPAKDLLDQGDQLARFIAKQQKPDGSLALTDAPEEVADPEGINHYPGIALYGLMRSQQQRPAAWKAEAARKALGYYRAWWREHRHPAFLAWQAPAFAEACLQSKAWTQNRQPDPAYAAFVYEMCDWLCTVQNAQLDARHPHWRGGFPEFVAGKPAPGAPKATGSACAAALVEACRVTRQLPDAERYNRYRDAANEALLFVMTLQYTEANTQHFAAGYRQQVLLGGFHGSPDDGALRLDATQHVVSALVQYMVYVLDL
jgi:hypothetical protein